MNKYDELRQAAEMAEAGHAAWAAHFGALFSPQTILALLDENEALRAAVLGLLNCETHSNHAPCRPCSLCESTLRKTLGDAS